MNRTTPPGAGNAQSPITDAVLAVVKPMLAEAVADALAMLDLDQPKEPEGKKLDTIKTLCAALDVSDVTLGRMRRLPGPSTAISSTTFVDKGP